MFELIVEGWKVVFMMLAIVAPFFATAFCCFALWDLFNRNKR